jgi:hypothetical protein
MQSYVQLTLNAYDELKKVQVEATTLVEQTNKNLSRKLTEANEKITELESDLRKYVIGGARMKPEQEMPPISEVKQIIELIANDEPTQTRGPAKLGRKRWQDYELGYMRQYAHDSYKLTDVAFSLRRTVSSIKTQASRMGLSSSNGILSEEW